MEKRVIEINDVSLRESAQVAGCALSPPDQKRYLELLIQGGIDRIEIGYPSSSPEQLRQCRDTKNFIHTFCITNSIRRPLVSALGRANEDDIKAIKRIGADICHIYIQSSEEFISALCGVRKSFEAISAKHQWVLNQVSKSISFAKNLGFREIQFSPEDAARSDFGFLCEVVGAAINSGATVINIPDTTGMRIGSEFGDLILKIRSAIPEINNAKISVHCHNDSDHSTHNAIQAILSGAQIVEGNFYGLGERSGMTKFESLIMNLNERGKEKDDLLSLYKINFNPSLCCEIVGFVAQALGRPVPAHWPVVGTQNNICSSGTHQAVENGAQQAGEKSPYYSWNPPFYGHYKGVETVVTSFSGKSGVRKKLAEIGIDNIGEKDLLEITAIAKKLSGDFNNKVISNSEMLKIVQSVLRRIPRYIEVSGCQVIGGRGTVPSAVVFLKKGRKEIKQSHSGNGPYDSLMIAIQKGAREIYTELKDSEVQLIKWRVESFTQGTDSLADVYVKIKVTNGSVERFSRGRATDPDTTQATAQAFANALSWYLNSILG